MQMICAEEKLDKISARLETSPRKSLDSLVQQRVCDCIIVNTNKVKLTYLHPYKTTVAYKL